MHRRRTTGRKQHEVGIDRSSIGQYDATRAVPRQFDACDRRVELEIDVFLPQLIGDERTHAVVEPAQKQRTSVQQCRSRAEARKDAGKFNGDVAAARRR